MLYFDRLTEDHFGSIRQQAWSFLHFPLHTVLVLVLQGISLLIIWRQAVASLTVLSDLWTPAILWVNDYVENGVNLNTFDMDSYFGHEMEYYLGLNYTTGEAFATYWNFTCYHEVYNYVPKGVDASKEVSTVFTSYFDIQEGLDNYIADNENITAFTQAYDGMNAMASATYKTLFDSFSVTVAKSKSKGGAKEVPDIGKTSLSYFKIFDLILSYTFVAVSPFLFLLTTYSTLITDEQTRVVSHSSSPLFSASSLFPTISVAQAQSSDSLLLALLVWV